MNKQKLTTAVLLLATVAILTTVVLGSKNKNTYVENQQSFDKNAPIFFYGDTCPHCADVEAWMKENKIEEKIAIVKKEVYNNRLNSQELTKAALSCGIPANSVGVPFLYAEGKCMIGTPDVIAYLTERVSSLSANSTERETE